MYDMEYYWDKKKYPKFSSFLKKLYRDSYRYYIDCHKVTNIHELDKVATSVRRVEEYYASLLSLDFVNSNNCSNILQQLESLKLFKFFSKQNSKLYGLTSSGTITLNSEIQGWNGVPTDFLKRIVVFHELGHVINASWIDDAHQLSSKLYQSPRVRNLLKNMRLNHPRYLSYGFDLLDEVVSQEVAEKVAYRMEGKTRPRKRYHINKRIFDYQPYLSNYVFYGELQYFATSFAKNLSFLSISSGDSDDEVMKKLCCASFSKNFILNIQQEIFQDYDKFDFFIMMLACMGRIKEATYQVIGFGNQSKPVNVVFYASEFKNMIKHLDEKENVKKKVYQKRYS